MATKEMLQLANDQALASTRLEEHIPTPEFLADCKAVIDGTMTEEQVRARSLARARALDSNSVNPRRSMKAVRTAAEAEEIVRKAGIYTATGRLARKYRD